MSHSTQHQLQTDIVTKDQYCVVCGRDTAVNGFEFLEQPCDAVGANERTRNLKLDRKLKVRFFSFRGLLGAKKIG